MLSRQRGLTLVELMVGVAVGLIVVAAATLLVTTQLGENRRLLLEAQVNQDLRAATDIVTRELRRAGSSDVIALQSVWTEAGGGLPNPLMNVTPDTSPASQVDFTYQRAAGDISALGFRHEGGVLRTRLGMGWQDLTDPQTLRVTQFTVTPRSGPTVRLPCPRLCADGSVDCWPTVTVRELVVDVAGHAVADPSVARSVRTVVRLRNDWVQLYVPGPPGQANRACPA